MILGETVEVLVPVVEGRDNLNNPLSTWRTKAVVDNVLVAPSSTSDLAGSTRPNGDELGVALHFPKSYQDSLRGCRLRVRGVLYTVDGDPIAYTTANTPGAWDRPVTARRTEG